MNCFLINCNVFVCFMFVTVLCHSCKQAAQENKINNLIEISNPRLVGDTLISSPNCSAYFDEARVYLIEFTLKNNFDYPLKFGPMDASSSLLRKFYVYNTINLEERQQNKDSNQRDCEYFCGRSGDTNDSLLPMQSKKYILYTEKLYQYSLKDMPRIFDIKKRYIVCSCPISISTKSTERDSLFSYLNHTFDMERYKDRILIYFMPLFEVDFSTKECIYLPQGFQQGDLKYKDFTENDSLTPYPFQLVGDK